MPTTYGDDSRKRRSAASRYRTPRGRPPSSTSQTPTATAGLLRRDLPGGVQVNEITVRVERLDDSLPDGFAPAFIKIDVEGGELPVIRGARDTIDRHRPIVVFESGKGASDRYGTTADMLYDLLVDDCGMRIFDLAGEGPYGRERLRETFDGNAKQPVWNYVACP